MKNVLQFIVLSFIFLIISNNNVFAQQDSISQSIIDYWKVVNDYSASNSVSNGLAKKASDAEVDSLAKKYYNAIATDPVGFDKYLIDQYRKWGDSVKNGYSVNSQYPGTLSEKIKNIIADKYGKHFVQIISVPSFVKVKILEKNISLVVNKNGSDIKDHKTNLNCEVEEVLKGDNFFKVGQKIIISYRLSWLSEDMENRVAPTGDQQFIVGKSYLIPIRYWDYNNPSQFAVYCFYDAYFPIYPIENGIISTSGDFFGIGETSNWEAFKKAFVQKYILK